MEPCYHGAKGKLYFVYVILLAPHNVLIGALVTLPSVSVCSCQTKSARCKLMVTVTGYVSRSDIVIGRAEINTAVLLLSQQLHAVAATLRVRTLLM